MVKSRFQTAHSKSQSADCFSKCRSGKVQSPILGVNDSSDTVFELIGCRFVTHLVTESFQIKRGKVSDNKPRECNG